jgi:hypothetical protein
MMAAYTVLAEGVYFHRLADGGPQFTIRYRGSVMPDDADPGDIARLLVEGMIGESAVPAEPTPPQSNGGGMSAMLAAVKSTAEQAASVASAAQAEVAGLQETATTYQDAIAASIADRQALWESAGRLAAGLDALRDEVAAIQLTPGPGPTAGQIDSAVAARLAASPPADGRNAEVRAGATGIEGRTAGDPWTLLRSWTDLTGPPGAAPTSAAIAAAVSSWFSANQAVELRATATAIQWRAYGGTWTDLVQLAAITGPAGPTPKMTAPLEPVTLPALQVGANDVSLTWATPMPSTSYQVFPSLSGTQALLGKLDVLVKPGQTKTGCVVTIANTSILPISLGAGTVSALAFSPN